ncbi:hypothetical protein Droror1_Dr00010231 [Drosera rotundifolia]
MLPSTSSDHLGYDHHLDPRRTAIKMKKSELILIPSPGAGHIVSFLQLARQLVERDDRFTITILIIKLPFDPPKSTGEDAATSSSIRYITLPDVEPPPIEVLMESWEKYNSDLIKSHWSNVQDVILKFLQSSSASLAGVIADLFCSPFIDLANELHVSSYLFFTSGAAFLSYILHMPSHFDDFGHVIRESDPESIITGFKNPYPSNLTPPFMLKEAGYTTFFNHARRILHAKGILINTFAELESYALGSFLGDGTPPVYTIGPILDLQGKAHGSLNSDRHDRIMGWLNRQPESSVVFLCFGSLGSMGMLQMMEVAIGLHLSGASFLWAVRKPPTEYMEEELQEILPAEFMKLLEAGKGIICGWAPQAQVLAHNAIAGFVSHCGWNSIMESLWFGRPLVTWPMYAEQRANAFQLVKEMELAVELSLDYDNEGGKIVEADKVERAIRCLMEQVNDLRKRAKEAADQGRRALMEGGSSFISLGSFIRDVMVDAKGDAL